MPVVQPSNLQVGEWYWWHWRQMVQHAPMTLSGRSSGPRTTAVTQCRCPAPLFNAALFMSRHSLYCSHTTQHIIHDQRTKPCRDVESVLPSQSHLRCNLQCLSQASPSWCHRSVCSQCNSRLQSTALLQKLLLLVST